MALLVLLINGGSVAAADSVVWRRTDAVPGNYTSTIVSAMADDTVYVSSKRGLEAIDLRSGRTRWRTATATSVFPIGPLVYASLEQPSGAPALLDLAAFDVATGSMRWRRQGSGGPIDADESGLVVGAQDGVASYLPDGTRRWFTKTEGGYRRLKHDGSYVVTLSSRGGATINGQLESLDTKTGKLVGTLPYVADVLQFDGNFVIAQSDSIGDVSFACYRDTLRFISLNTATPKPYGPVLAWREVPYLLDMPPLSYTDSQCNGPRTGRPAAIVDGGRVVLASGPVIGLFALSGEKLSTVRGPVLVGGPWFNHYFMVDDAALRALSWQGKTARFSVIEGGAPTSRFSVAGLGDRLYVSSGTSLTAYDATDYRRLARIPLQCARIRAVGSAHGIDILACSRSASEYSGVSIVALAAPRTPAP